MKFSSSLLENKDISTKIFNNSIAKANLLLKDVFGLNFDGNDLNIKKINEDADKFRYGVIFTLNGREITVSLTYNDEDNSDILTEVLSICESISENFIAFASIKNVKEADSQFFDNVKEVQNYLEEKFDLNFTPLDPDDKDINIVSIELKEDNFTMNSIFKQEHHEGTFEVKYKFVPGQKQIVTLIQHKQHKIYLN